MLLLHGLSSNAAGWWRLAPDLVELGLEVVAPDLRGHGQTGPRDDLSIEAYRDDVLAAGNGWDLVVGHSLGGTVALACQSSDDGFAESLVLEDPPLRVGAGSDLLAQLLAEYDTVTDAELAAAKPRWAPEDIRFKLEALAAAGPGVVEATYQSLAQFDGWPEVARLAVPTLIIGADPMEGSAMVSELDGRRAGRNPAVRYVAVPGASHSVHRDSYGAFLALVVEFAERLGLVSVSR